MTRDMRHRLPLLLMLLAGSACSSPPMRLYDGPAKPAGEVARIMAVNDPFWVYVDGASAAGRHFYEVLPGTHTAVVSWTLRSGQQLFEDKQTITFFAQAGHRYRPAGTALGSKLPATGGAWRAEIQDVGSTSN